MTDGEKFVIIANPLDEQEWRNGVGRIEKIPIHILKNSAKEFIDNISNILDEIEITLKNFELNQVELTATVTSSGQLSLVVGNIEGGFEGGIKFVFKRKD